MNLYKIRRKMHRVRSNSMDSIKGDKVRVNNTFNSLIKWSIEMNPVRNNIIRNRSLCTGLY